MGFNEEAAAALEALARHEAAIGEFYKSCAAKFPERAAEFAKIAEEEAGHSALLLAAKDVAENSEVALFPPEALAPGLIESSTKYVRREIERLKSAADYSPADAASVALRIEESFFDHNVFESFLQSPASQLRETARTLNAETAAHAKAFRGMLASLKSPEPAVGAPEVENAKKPDECAAVATADASKKPDKSVSGQAKAPKR